MRHPSCRRTRAVVLAVMLAVIPWARCADSPLPGTTLLTGSEDRSEQMRAAIERYLDRELEMAVAQRSERWQRDVTSNEAYVRSVDSNRERFARMIGLGEPRVESPELDVRRLVGEPESIARSSAFTAHAARWRVYADVEAEGVLLQPSGAVRARIVVLPDADQTPEQVCGLVPGIAAESQFARRLAEAGCQVLVPALVSRADTFSGSEVLNRLTNQPHREWIYRQAYTFGGHIIGYEVEQVRAALDWFATREPGVPLGVAGWGEGGLIAFYSAAVDPRVRAALVSGYFGGRDALFAEPIYRNVSGLLREFGDAEIASLIAPRGLIIEPSPAPAVSGPPAARAGRRTSAALGAITTPRAEAVQAEFQRARKLAGAMGEALKLLPAAESPFATSAFREFLGSLGVAETYPSTTSPLEMTSARSTVSADGRQRRIVAALEAHTQAMIDTSRNVRDATFWKDTPITTPAAWDRAMEPKREQFWNEIIGRLPRSTAPLNVRSRILYDRHDSIGYEVVLDALPDLPLWGYLLLPKTLTAGERRPIVVAQHGLAGLPADMINEDPAQRAHRVYKALATQLVRRGFVVFVPHFPWRAQEDYRRLQRKANPLGLSVFSFILAHHTRLLDWVETLPFVDSKRIGFYGLSWGGKVALRVPALEPRYALSICSGDFNEWIWKNATTSWPNSYMFAPEPDMFDFNLGPTFSHAEMAAMIAPRPFMVERGHADGVGTDERVAFEYARVYRLYNKLRIPERTTIEFFDGVHEIYAVGTFHFLQRHFNWPPPIPKPF